MQTTKTNSVRERWQAIISEAEQHPVSMKAYCEEKGIRIANLYVMRGKLRRAQRPTTTAKSFARVEVVERQAQLPDAEWVAKFLRHLVGCGR